MSAPARRTELQRRAKNGRAAASILGADVMTDSRDALRASMFPVCRCGRHLFRSSGVGGRRPVTRSGSLYIRPR